MEAPMFGKQLTLFRPFGIAVRFDLGTLLVALLVAWSLAVAVFPNRYPGLAHATYWWMGAAGAIGLYAAVLIHELSHALVGRRDGIPIKGITLFVFGGLAEMEGEPPTPRAELRMAAAGPLMSIVLGCFFGLIFLLGERGEWPVTLTGTMGYLSTINFVLAIFNLVPAFPLDGGRILRAALWGWKRDLRWSTRISSRLGEAFGVSLIVLAFIVLLYGDVVSALWWSLIGVFLKNAAVVSYRQLVLRQSLEGQPVSQIMNPDPISVAPETSLQDLSHDYIEKHHLAMFPVVEGGRLSGCVRARNLRQVPRGLWNEETVASVVEPCSTTNTVPPDFDAFQALLKMEGNRGLPLLVAVDDRLVGVLSMPDILARTISESSEEA
jgi:Zn-dependent protease/CBS domain-containing protein